MGVTYRCWLNMNGSGRILAKFVPKSIIGDSAWGPVYSGTVFVRMADGRRVSEFTVEHHRFFADELEPWVPV